MATRQGLATQVRWASGLNIAAGAWLILAPFVLMYSDVTGAVWNDVLVGIAVLAFAWYRTARPASGIGASWTNAVLGGWLVLAPFALAYSDVTAAISNDIVLGVIVLSLAIWSAAAGGRLRTESMGSPRDRRAA
jgi:hypothetical protein